MRNTVLAGPLTSGDVAREAGLSRERIVQLDAELRPELTPRGRRIYRRDVVDAFLARRKLGRRP